MGNTTTQVVSFNRGNHHEFQLLANAALGLREIAAPIGGILSTARSARILMITATELKPLERSAERSIDVLSYN